MCGWWRCFLRRHATYLSRVSHRLTLLVLCFTALLEVFISYCRRYLNFIFQSRRIMPLESRLSSRTVLTRSLGFAREAVLFDSYNDDRALVLYEKSVALLREVMERVMKDEDNRRGSDRGRILDLQAQNEDLRRLQSIVSTIMPSWSQ